MSKYGYHRIRFSSGLEVEGPLVVDLDGKSNLIEWHMLDGEEPMVQWIGGTLHIHDSK